MKTTNRRNDWAGGPKGKQGKARLSLPTQSLEDREIVELVPFRVDNPGFRLTDFGTPHKLYPTYTLQHMEPYLGDNNSLFVMEVYRKRSGVPLDGSVVSGGTWGEKATTTRQRVEPGTEADSGIGVLESSVTAETAQTAYRTTTFVDWPTLTTTRINERGDLETTVMSKVDPGELLPNDTLFTTRITQEAETKDRATLTVSSVSEYSTLMTKEWGSDQLARFAKDGVTQVVVDEVGPETEPEVDDPGDSERRIISSRVVQTSKTKARKTTVSAPALMPLVSVNAVDPAAWGAQSVTVETVVAAGATLPTPTFNTLSSERRALNPAQAIQTVTTASFPELPFVQVDDRTGLVVTGIKKFVPKGTAGGVFGDEYREIQPFNHLKSIQIASKIDLSRLPAPKTKKITFRKTFPAELKDYYFICYLNSDGVASERIGFHYDMYDPFAMAIEAQEVTSYHYGPPTDSIEITPFLPQSHKLTGITWPANSEMTDRSTGIPSCLHGEINWRWAAWRWGTGIVGGVSSTPPTAIYDFMMAVFPLAYGPIPATKPATLTAGAQFIEDVTVEEWRFNLFVRKVITAKIPARI